MPADFVEDVTVFIGHATIIPKRNAAAWRAWRETLFAFLMRNGERTGAFFCVPTRQVWRWGRRSRFEADRGHDAPAHRPLPQLRPKAEQVTVRILHQKLALPDLDGAGHGTRHPPPP